MRALLNVLAGIDVHASPRQPPGYPSDLTGCEGSALALMILDAGLRGRPRKIEKREIVEALPDVLRAACAWRLPAVADGLPPPAPVAAEGRRGAGPPPACHGRPLAGEGRDAPPSIAVVDSQTVRTSDRKGLKRLRRRV